VLCRQRKRAIITGSPDFNQTPLYGSLRHGSGGGANPGRTNMANTAQAKKRARQAELTRQRNASQKSELRTAVKKVRKAIASGDKAAAAKTLQESQAVMDRIADKKVVHKNLVSRTKSRLASAIKALA
jgi:small subunit ribosomal protein S20